jgi:hypothetical protein
MPRAGVSVPAKTLRGGEASEDERLPTTDRRTVIIQGRGAERNLPAPRSSARRPYRRPYERAGFRPDRAAKWAVLLGIVLVLVAATSSRGANRAHAQAAVSTAALHARH